MSQNTSQIASRLAGKFLVLDGPDGCGKSTQCKLLAERLRAERVDVVECRDPGGTDIGERVRAVLLDHDLSAMDVRCETLLFMAARAQLVTQVVEPALTSGAAVICDRFVTATCAYQGAAGGDPQRIIELARWAIANRWPEQTVVIDVPTETGFSRMKGNKRDAMEQRPIEFHRRVRELFLEIGEHYPAPVTTIDGTGSPGEVHELVLKAVCDAFC